jgi:dipeptidyl aminopeptidase/acylaminoacyl peptidase
MTDKIPFGAWPSTISAESVVAGVVGFSELNIRGEEIFWLESRPAEQGRSVLIAMTPEGARRDLTPPPFNVRSRVHEYGGGAYCLAPDAVFFVNFPDQNIFRVNADGKIDRITPGGADERFADLCFDMKQQRLLCVLERHSQESETEPENVLAAVDVASGEVTVLDQQHDFYACPRLSPSGEFVAWVAWSHPNMPWDGSLLMRGAVDADGSIGERMIVAGGADESVTQPVWMSDESLLFISDQNGFYNLYCFDEQGIRCLLSDGADYAQPAWVFGQREYAIIDGGHVAAIRQTQAGPELVVINLNSGMASPLSGEGDPWRYFDSLCAQDNQLFFIAGYADRLPAIDQLTIATGKSTSLALAAESSFDDGISIAEAVSYPTRDGEEAYGYFYPPANALCRGPDGDLPPLLVMSHGGPTAAASSALQLKIQYYTSRGWSVLDVNYRGSSGFGRRYRNALNGRWGELDVWDCEDGVRFLAGQRRIDPNRVAIRGGSAGGFTTLAALCTTTTFKSGASHYGIGDLTALANDTHKFESRYLHTLLANEENLQARSPINHLDGLACPVIFFQGGEDKVVPPNQAEAMVAALKDKNIPVAYLLFPEEGHGFRAADNIVRALESEFAFFSRIFGITPAEALPDVEIFNAGGDAA